MPVTGESSPAHQEPEETFRHGRLTVRAGSAVSPSGRTGLVPFAGPRGEELAVAYVPRAADGGSYRLTVLLHGAGGSARQALDLMLPFADQRGLLLVAPQSTAVTWDLLSAGFGPDVRRIDRVLQDVVAAYPVSRMVIAGFSDGASYALSIGLNNGDVFDTVLAFSPGFAAPMVTHGLPRVFVSHGTGDQVLPVARCSRRVVPRLRALGYEVTYEEFDGGHEVPDRILRLAVDWLDRSV